MTAKAGGAMLLIAGAVAACNPLPDRDVDPEFEVDRVSAVEEDPVMYVTFTRFGGGSMSTDAGAGMVINRASGLEREWIVVTDERLPVSIIGEAGIRTVYVSPHRYRIGGYEYRSDFSLVARKDIAAVEVRIVVFDVWGDFVRTLSLTQIQDVAAGETIRVQPRWQVFRESEVADHYGSLAYVARVRTSSGRILEAEYERIVGEIRTFSKRFTPELLEPGQAMPGDTTLITVGTQ
jgi:hypothetical protein